MLMPKNPLKPQRILGLEKTGMLTIELNPVGWKGATVRNRDDVCVLVEGLGRRHLKQA
jgi:hypothetical protein